MIRHTASEVFRKWEIWAGLVTALVIGLVIREAGRTLEMGSRLYRWGQTDKAANVNLSVLDGEEEKMTATYNLGTAFVLLGSDEVERYLDRATRGRDSAFIHRAHYNLGYRLLTAADGSADPVSSSALLIGAIKNYRAVVRLDPGDRDARWNLALAQRRFEELPPVWRTGCLASGCCGGHGGS